jgi:hypothetical protein
MISSDLTKSKQIDAILDTYKSSDQLVGLYKNTYWRMTGEDIYTRRR